MPLDSPVHVASVLALLTGVLLVSAGLGLAIGDTAGRTNTSPRSFTLQISLVPVGAVLLVSALLGAFVINS